MKNIFKNIVLIIFIILQISSIYSQEKVHKFYIVSSLSSNKPDARIFGYPVNVVNNMIEQNIETPPDNVFETGIGMGYKLLDFFNFRVIADLRYIYERNNYIRPLNYCQILKEGQPCNERLYYLDIYSYNMFGNSITIDYSLKLYKKLVLLIGFSYQIDFKFLGYYKEALTSENKNFHKKIDFMSFELDPFIGLGFGRYDLSVYKRLWYYHKIDRAIHANSSGSGHPVLKNDYETYNPERWGIVLKYWF
ncbi:MAG: hypothetical protein ACM3PT_09275 [Deltaproteobacteria bacterium]